MSPDPEKILPLSHPVRVEGIKLRPGNVTVSAPAEALPRIAAELGLASLEALEAHYTLSRNGEKVKLEGAIQAKAHQICVVTLESFPVEIKVPMKLDFAPEDEARIAARRGDAGDEGEIDIEVRLNEADPPEPIVDGVIDLGAVTLEFLALALDPYPRKPGVSFDVAPAEPGIESPFAVLAKLKREQ
ncbi:Uncharacterized ACR, COG1399 [Bosea sp. OK403]|uniref:YceD family protein n=1 Tax=Bosea sp. OK403 TaxID=1855286 RepID=UPI0008EFAB37|nr:DUF177 domain-containing protein [Bosea sp. OK403]SFH98189.1 Uncharacterized ACR, COG1399 [Bosea sp. OK403]